MARHRWHRAAGKIKGISAGRRRDIGVASGGGGGIIINLETWRNNKRRRNRNSEKQAKSSVGAHRDIIGSMKSGVANVNGVTMAAAKMTAKSKGKKASGRHGEAVQCMTASWRKASVWRIKQHGVNIWQQ